MAYYFQGLALENLLRYAEAAEAFEKSGKAGYDARNSELHRAGALRRIGKIDDAKKILHGLETHGGSSAEYHFQQGAMLASEGELELASVELEKALSLDKDHNGALFELAYINDIHGNDEAAVDFYKRCTERPPVPLAAWINLGVLYEDEMRFREAEKCYRQVLAHDPNHPRARLFVEDCLASKGMYYDEEAEKGYTVLKQLLEIPVTDFELSVRSRNCLRKMNIRTLGDLTRTTEMALLWPARTSARPRSSEIKEMMQSKGLRLGMALEGADQAGHPRPPHGAAPGNPPRAAGDALQAHRRPEPLGPGRKCMSKLNIQAIGDLPGEPGTNCWNARTSASPRLTRSATSSTGSA